jgi:TP901 family phage tail tape measure protein
MSQPTVTATITANDLASPKLRELISTLKQIEQTAKQAFSAETGRGYATGLNQATEAAQKHAGALKQIHAAHKQIAATVAGYAGFKMVHGTVDAIKNSLPYLREDRAMQARTGYTDSEMRELRRQQGQLAGRYGSKVEDTLKAQETFGRLQYDAKTNAAMVGPTAVGARAMGVSTDKVAELMEAMISQTGMTFSSPEDAAAKTKRLNDIAATATKKSNMSFDDVKEFESYSAAAANSAGISPEQNLAMGMALRRGGIVGSEGGVFARQFAARVMAPTRKGREMLAQHGINIDEFATHGTISGEGLSDKLARNFGKGLSKGAIASLNKDLEEHGEDILGSRAAYSKAVMAAVQSSGEKLSKTDQKHVTASANEYYDFSKSGFKGGALLEALLNSGDPMVMQGLLGDKQGARANALLTEKDKYFEAKEHLQGSDGFSQKVADEMGKGLAAAVDKLTASFDSLEKNLVKANEEWLTPMVNAATSVVGMFNNLSDGGKEVVGAIAGVTAVLITGGLAYAFVRTVASVNSLAMSAGEASLALQTLAGRSAVGAAVPGAVGAAGAGVGVGAIGAVGTLAAGTIAALYLRKNQIDNMTNDQLDDVVSDWTNPDVAVYAAGRKRGPAAFPAALPSNRPFDRYQPTSLDNSTSRFLLGGGADGMSSGGWHDSIVLGQPGASKGFGDPGKTSTQVDVQGTVTGSAELHNNIAVDLKPSKYFESLVQRAENVANMSINGRLGTSMQGPGDNGTKPSQSALTGTQ